MPILWWQIQFHDDKTLRELHQWIIMRREIQIRWPHDFRCLHPNSIHEHGGDRNMHLAEVECISFAWFYIHAWDSEKGTVVAWESSCTSGGSDTLSYYKKEHPELDKMIRPMNRENQILWNVANIWLFLKVQNLLNSHHPRESKESSAGLNARGEVIDRVAGGVLNASQKPRQKPVIWDCLKMAMIETFRILVK